MLIFGIDKFMSECRALVNFCGNAVATLFIAHWDKTLDVDRARRVFRGDDVPPLHEIDEVTTTSEHDHRAPVGPGPVAGPVQVRANGQHMGAVRS
jgi:aerobic C4-dicarboxylate transport protein